MKSIISILFFCVSPILIFSQNIEVLKKNATEKNNAVSWNALATYYFEKSDIDACHSCAEKAYDLAVKEKNNKETGHALMTLAASYEHQLEWDKFVQVNKKASLYYEAAGEFDLQLEAINNIGYAYNTIGKYDEAIIAFKGALDLIHKEKMKEGQAAVTLINMAFAYLYKGELAPTKNYIVQAISAAEIAKDTIVLIEGNNQLGVIYKREGDYLKALEHYERSLLLYELTDDKRKLCTVWLNISNLYYDWGKFNKALELGRKALVFAEKYNLEKPIVGQVLSSVGLYLLKNNKYNEGLDTLRMSLPYFKESKYQNYLVSLYLANAFEHTNQSDSCEFYLQKAEDLLAQNKNFPAVRFYSNKGTWLYKKGRYNEAIPLLESYVKEFQNNPTKNQMSESYIFYNALSESYELGPKNLQSALFYKKLAYEKRDSLYKEEHNNTINDFYARYETAEKELEISRLNEEKQKTKFQTTLMISIAGLLIVLLFIAFLYNRIKRIKEEKEAVVLKARVEQKDTEYKILLSNTEQNMLRKYLEGRESERKALAKELHDSIASDIISIMMLHENIERKEQVSLMLKDTYSHIREISHQLMPPEFKYMSLIGMLEDHVDILNSTMTTRFFVNITDSDIPSVIEEMSDSQMKEIYYIIQEVLGNIRKHAEAMTAEIRLSLDKEEKLIILIIDDGKGFNVQQNSKGIGLRTIKDRCTDLNANLEIESVIGKGTTVAISLFYSINPEPDRRC